MRPGKISESVLKRSVLKQIKTKREEIRAGAGVGTDCSFFVCNKEEGCLLATGAVVIEDRESLTMGIVAIVNNVAAAGGEPVGILSSLVLPDKILESELQKYTAEIERSCKNLDLQVAGGNTCITGAVNKPILNLTVFGKKEINSHKGYNTYQGEEDIILTKWIGLAGTAILSEKREQILQERLPMHLIEEAKRMKEKISVLPESRIGTRLGAQGMHDVSRGGIFAALWELVEDKNVGLEVDLRKLTVRQETIEICEILEINPYELYGAGALLMVTKNGGSLLRELEKEGIPAVIIGKITKDCSKVIYNGEEKRYLERPGKEALEVLRQKG
ncbi:MAG: hydrogenase maturation factor [Lachnospiraceae bacterium]|nr:hydrogenase maturation factor [Lachnospiraceae bacterium]